MSITRHKGFLSTFLTSALIVLITVITHFNKHLFIDQPFNTDVVGFVIIILSIALLFRIPYVRIVLAVIATLFILYIAAKTIESPSDFYLIPRAIMFTVLLFVWYMLLFEEAVKIYVRRKAKGRSKIPT
jgi:hypothetical protein